MKYNVVLITYLLPVLTQASIEADHRNTRTQILKDELKRSIGGEIVLDDKEKLVNEVLMHWKHEELDQELIHPEHSKFSESYFKYKDDITKSKVYELIASMPKGAALHQHANVLLGSYYFLNVTYKEYLHVCFGKILKFKFSYSSPKTACETQWKLMSDVRKSLVDVSTFDLELRTNFTLVGVDHSDIGSIWKRFTYIFDVIYPIWSYRPVWEEYFYEVLNEFRNDKVMYMEVRSSFPELYELDGQEYDEVFFINTTKRVVDRFVEEHPDFLGVKMICSFNRHVKPKRVEELLRLTKKSQKIFPNFIAGFDLVGHEDVGGSLLQFLPELQAAGNELHYFFHAGETNWYGATPDENLVDAVLLGTKRIGHGYALEKHPLVLEIVKKEKIGLEVNLVSNNVLDYVHDMRNHPLALFISQGLPVVLSSDDPGLWEAAPLSTDFYIAFMGVASRSHDLRLLKQFALNSIEYSALNHEKKKKAYVMFYTQWKKFIDEFITDIRKNNGTTDMDNFIGDLTNKDNVTEHNTDIVKNVSSIGIGWLTLNIVMLLGLSIFSMEP